MTITAYKGFNKDFTCRGFRFEVGKTYTHDGEVEVCYSGFHACVYPLDVLNFYPPSNSVYASVQQSGRLDISGEDSKIASGEITIEEELDILKLINAAICYINNSHNGHGECKKDKVITDYDYSISSTINNYKESYAYGISVISANTGIYATSCAHGISGISAATGRYGLSSVTGEYSVSCTTAINSLSSAISKWSTACSTGVSSVAVSENTYSIASATGIGSAALAMERASLSCASGINSIACSTGASSIACITGSDSAALVTNENSIACATGAFSSASSTGRAGASIASGYKTTACAENYSTAIACWNNSKAKGGEGCAIVIVTRYENGEILHIKASKVGENGIKPNVYYTLDDDGEFVEADEYI